MVGFAADDADSTYGWWLRPLRLSPQRRAAQLPSHDSFILQPGPTTIDPGPPHLNGAVEPDYGSRPRSVRPAV